jgi:uncharacterized membrane protein
MGCLTSIYFVVLINGSTSSFFNPTMGLRKGFPFSPFLFLIIVEGLHKAILKTKITRVIYGVEVRRNISLLYLLFVDDVLLFIKGYVREAR